METTANNQVAIIEKSLDVLKTGHQILIANQARKEKALEVGRNILSAIEETGMTTELDERANKYLSNISKANTEMKADRAPVTQIMDQLKKMYTEVENDIDSKKPETIPSKIQAHRDRFAKEVAAEAERKRIAAEEAAQKAKAIIDIRYQMESSFANQFNDILLNRKSKVSNAFNAITLENFESKSEGLKNATFSFDLNSINDLPINSALSNKISADELLAIEDEVIQNKMPDAISNYQAEMELLKEELIEKLPSKLSELQEQKRLNDEAEAEAKRAVIAEQKRQEQISKANAKEKKRLEAEAEIERQKEKDRQAEIKKMQEVAAEEKRKREAEESERLMRESEDQKRQAELDADIKKQGEQTMVMFEQEAAMADTAPAPETRQGYDIQVLHPVGYTQIFAFWFENEGKNLPVDKIGNTKLDQMKSWAEKHAQKVGAKIDSKFLKYEESFKAVNRKAK